MTAPRKRKQAMRAAGSSQSKDQNCHSHCPWELLWLPVILIFFLGRQKSQVPCVGCLRVRSPAVLAYFPMWQEGSVPQARGQACLALSALADFTLRPARGVRRARSPGWFLLGQESTFNG